MLLKLWNLFILLINALVFSNTWIALGALSIYASVISIFNLPFNGKEAVTVFSSTFIGYNLLKLKGLSFQNNNSIFFDWLKRHQTFIYVALLLVSIVMLVSLSFLSKIQWMVLVITTLVSVFYIGVERFNLRAFWFLKTPIVAFVWAFFLVLIALANQLNFIAFKQFCFVFIAIFLLIQGLTIPFEIRDWQADQRTHGLLTIPMVFGFRKTKILAIIHLLFSFVFFLLLNKMLFSLLPIFALAIWVILQLKKHSSEYYYTFLLDGILVLFWPVVYLTQINY